MAAPLGNRNAAKAKNFERQLRAAVEQDDWKRVRQGCELIMDAAARGERPALEFIRDTLDGKPMQQIQALDEEGRSVAVALITYSPPAQIQPEALPAPDTEGTGLRH